MQIYQRIFNHLKDLSFLPALRFSVIRWRICKYSLIFSDALVLFLFFQVWRGSRTPSEIDFSHLLGANLGSYLPVGHMDWFVVCSVLMVSLSFLYGGYSKRRLIWDDMRSIINFAVLIGLVDLSVLLISAASAPVLHIVLQWVFLAIALPVGRHGVKHVLLLAGVWQIPTRILGTGDNAVQACRTLAKEPVLGYVVDAFIKITDHPDHVSGRIEGIPVIEYTCNDDLEEQFLSGKSVFSEHHIVFAPENMSDETLPPIINVLTAYGHEVDLVPPVRGLPLLGMEVSHVFGQEAVILHTKNALSRPVMRGLKRLFDFVVSLLCLSFVLPLMVVVAIYIKREDGGPVFFCQSRVGYHGKPFKCIKFRTMKTDAEQILASWKNEGHPIWHGYVENNFKIKDDPRVTRVGRFLRSTSLDELPQILNVLMGEMSLVGPRPMLHSEAESDWARHIHYRRVRPGITGMWQISGRSNTSFQDRVAYDEWYSKNWSIWHDVIIIMKTVSVLVKREGAF